MRTKLVGTGWNSVALERTTFFSMSGTEMLTAMAYDQLMNGIVGMVYMIIDTVDDKIDWKPGSTSTAPDGDWDLTAAPKGVSFETSTTFLTSTMYDEDDNDEKLYEEDGWPEYRVAIQQLVFGVAILLTLRLQYRILYGITAMFHLGNAVQNLYLVLSLSLTFLPGGYRKEHTKTNLAIGLRYFLRMYEFAWSMLCALVYCEVSGCLRERKTKSMLSFSGMNSVKSEPGGSITGGTTGTTGTTGAGGGGTSAQSTGTGASTGSLNRSAGGWDEVGFSSSDQEEDSDDEEDSLFHFEGFLSNEKVKIV